jgi:hypothetical protein
MTAHDREEFRKLVAHHQSPTLHLQSPCTSTQTEWLLQVRPPSLPSAQQDTNDTPLRRNTKHTTRAICRKGLLQKVHRAEASLERRRRSQRCRSSTQSPSQQSNHEDAPRTRFPARATRKASAKHYRWSWQTCQQQQQLRKQRLETARESARYTLSRPHAFYWRWRILHWCSRGFSKRSSQHGHCKQQPGQSVLLSSQ